MSATKDTATPSLPLDSGDRDLELMRRLKGGDVRALDELMARYASRIYRLARAIARNEADAEEVVQDVFVTLLRKHDTFEGRSAVGSWIYRIAVNTALNQRRSRRADLEVAIDESLPVFKADGHRDGESSFVLADWSENPEAELLADETRAVLTRGIERLPDHYRAVLVMRDVDGLGNAEVAQILGETVASVKSTLHRARMALREQLTRHFSQARGE